MLGIEQFTTKQDIHGKIISHDTRFGPDYIIQMCYKLINSKLKLLTVSKVPQLLMNSSFSTGMG